MKPKPAVIEAICFSKRIYVDSQNYLLPTADKYDFSFGLLLIQDAIELLLGAVALHRNIQMDGKATIYQYFEKIASKLQAEIPYRGEIEKINKARVDIKHYGILKNFTDYKNEISFLPYFFEELSKKAFGLNFTEISMADLIENKKIKEKILDAEKLLQEKKYKECVEKLAWARHEIIGIRFIPGGALYEAFGITPADNTNVCYENFSDTRSSMTLLQHGMFRPTHLAPV